MTSDKEKIGLVLVVGPTASGKSELALRLAERFGGEIVNADSVQVYCGMDIGTAKPSAEALQRVPHHLLNLVTPDQDFSAADFRVEASRAIADIHRRGKPVFLVGGTGLYLKALLQGLVDSPGGDASIRAVLQMQAELEGKESLLQRLALVDPESAARLHPNDQQRIIRALEVFMLTGRPISAFHGEHGFAGADYLTLKIGIRLDRVDLYRRIDERVEQMMINGLLAEVQGLLGEGYAPELKALRSLGYKQLCAHLAGECSLAEAVRLIKRDTRHYAKRQLTWFNKDSAIKWVEYPANFATICSTVMEFLA